jgi:hypothetical protein
MSEIICISHTELQSWFLSVYESTKTSKERTKYFPEHLMVEVRTTTFEITLSI